MGTHLSTGTLFSISADLPTTYDDDAVTGYPAGTYTAVGEVIDIGEIGIAYNPVEHQSVSKRYPTKKKGVYNHDDVAVTAALDEDDAGQVLVDAALASDNSYALKITDTDGNDRYFTGKVMSAKPGPWAGDDTVTKAITISVDPETGFTGAAA